MKALQPSAVLLGTVALVSLTVFGACERSATQPSVTSMSAAKGGAEDPTVESTNPSSAPQDTTLDVEVSGSGFDNGSRVDFGRNGEPTPHYIMTNQTRFVGPKKLIANITIADTALVELYDVIVTTRRGKKGIGTELFQVRQKGKPQPDPAINVTIDDVDDLGNEYNIRSDGRGIYKDNVCNVDATFNLNDARLSLPGRIKKKDQAACGDPKTIHVQFPGQAVEGSPDAKAGWFREMRFMNVDHVETVTDQEFKMAAFGFMGCAHGLRFEPAQSTAEIEVNDVIVTRVDDNTWTVATRPYPDNVAVCIPDEDNPKIEYEREYYRMTFSLTVELQ